MLRRVDLLPVFFLAVSACAQTAIKPIEPAGPPKQANALKEYVALRNDLPNSGSVTVKDLTIQREGGIFLFDEGTFYFYGPVNGRDTGAVFEGKGRFSLAVRDSSEQRSLALLTKSGDGMTQDFSTLVLRFTDGTADEIRKASTGSGSPADGRVRSAAEDFARSYRKAQSDNIDLRLLADVIDVEPGQFFLASFRMGGALLGRNVLFIVDPEGTFHASPDEVELTTWSDTELQPWVAYKMQHANESLRGQRIQVSDERLDVTIEHNATIHANAETTFKVRRDGMRVVRLNLYPTLRVSGVYSETGMPLDFVQESKDLDPDFAVILPEPAKAGQTLRILIEYSGKDALRADGNDTYYLMSGARDSWYPASGATLGNYASFHMTFHIPKQLTIVATGKQKSLTHDGNVATAVWDSEVPIPVAGFNIGDFKTFGAKTPQGFEVDAYADHGLPIQYSGLADADTLGGLSSTQALKGEVAQGNVAIQIYSDYFGKLPYDHVALTEQTACNYGQSWPMLVYLPICGFWDATVQQQLGLLDQDKTYWREVTPHEVSHQWWGQLVGFKSYRDQWMSEGFANFSVGIFLLNSAKMDDFRAFWKEQQKNLLQKNAEGRRPIDVGPLTMGYRLNNSKSGEDVYQMLVYSKGAYILHMLEMAYWTPADGENLFKRSMQQFVSDFAGKAATTEDWKAEMEKTMPKWMDLRGDGKLDWFFNEYVYGTELPHYVITSEVSPGQDGASNIHMKLTQSNVSSDFVMRIPLYLQMQNGTTIRIANLVMHGDSTMDHTFPMKGLPSPPKMLLVNYNGDVLSD